jgi:hypothetical protein
VPPPEHGVSRPAVFDPFRLDVFRRADMAGAALNPPCLMYVSRTNKLTYMEKIQVYLRKEELDALRKAARRSGRSVAALVREAVRATILQSPAAGPIAIWDGKPKRTSVEHDSIYDEP